MPAFETIAEQRIREDMERGEFDRLPGARSTWTDSPKTVTGSLRD